MRFVFWLIRDSVGDDSGLPASDLQELSVGRGEDPVAVAARRPDLVVLAEIHVDERADGGREAEWRHAASGFRNPWRGH